MKMTKIKTAGLAGAQLDFAVGRANGLNVQLSCPHENIAQYAMFGPYGYSPSTDWAIGGPLIECEKISVNEQMIDRWCADIRGAECMYGMTALEAICRAFVASKLGDEVEVPEVGSGQP